MVKKEWKSIWKNPLLIIVLAAIILIPSIYTTFFLASMWDPYGQLDKLPVAVVNQDKSVTYKDKKLSVGSELVDQLKENKELDFHFTDKKEADTGIHSGKYYMVITIPEDFSKNASTLMDKHPKKMQLEYSTNPGTNYIASKLSSTALAKIENKVADEVTRTYAETVFEQLGTIGDGMEEGADGASKLTDGTEKLQEGNDKIHKNLEVLAQSTLTFKDGSNTLKRGLTDYTNGVNQLSDGASTLAKGSKTLHKGTSDLQSGSSALSSGASSLNSGIQDYVAGVNQLKTGANQLSGLTNLDQVYQGVHSLKTAVADGTEGRASLKSATAQLAGSLDALESQVNALADQLAEGEAESIDPSTIQALASNLHSASVAADAISQGTASAASGLTSLDQSTKAFPTAAAGVKKLIAGFDTLTENNAALTQGASQLNAGAKSLDQGAKSLNKGSKDLMDGANTLAAGGSKLSSNNKKLLDGADQLSDGAGKIQDGSSKLAKGSSQVQDGLDELNKGSKKLSTALSDGAKEIRENEGTDSTLDMFSTPVSSNETKVSQVPNNGSAMSAYMMCVGLWVGALAFCLMYPLTQYGDSMKNGFSWWFSKASVAYPLALAMAFVMLQALHHFCGFAPVDFTKTALVACVASCTFMAIMYFFNVAFGKIGSFLMLVFMVIQLAGSAGTYPVELSAGFVAKIHNYLPFSYVVEAFRMGICGEGSVQHALVVLGTWGVVFTCLTIVLFVIRGRKIKKGQENFYDKLEHAGLA